MDLCPRKWGFLWRMHCVHIREEGSRPRRPLDRCKLGHFC